jgi:hypothetical protein
MTEAQIRHQPVAPITYDGGPAGSPPRTLFLPQAGYLSALTLVTTITATLSAPPAAPDQFAIYQGAAAQHRLFINTEGELYNLDGFMGKLVEALDDQYMMGAGRVYNPPQDTFSPAPGINAVTNRWVHRIPLALYLQGSPLPLGLYNTALQNLSVELQARFLPVVAATGLLPGSGIYTSGTATASVVSGQVDVNMEYFEPITVQNAQPPLRYIHRWTQFEVPIGVSSGVVDIPLPGRQRYTRIIYAVLNGGSSTTVGLDDSILTRLQLTYGAQSHPEDETYDQARGRMRRQYGDLMNTWPGGVYTHDFLVGSKSSRDWFNAGLTTNLRAQLTFSGATTGVGSKVICATEEIISLAPTAASPQGVVAVGG